MVTNVNRDVFSPRKALKANASCNLESSSERLVGATGRGV